MVSLCIPTFHMEVCSAGAADTATARGSPSSSPSASPSSSPVAAADEGDVPTITWPLTAEASVSMATLSTPAGTGSSGSAGSSPQPASSPAAAAPACSATSGGPGSGKRTVYHFVITAPDFERTVYKRWSSVCSFDARWAALYPQLHRQFKLEQPSAASMLFQSKLKRQQERMRIMQTYFRALLPVTCLRASLASFLDVPAAVLGGGSVFAEPVAAVVPSTSKEDLAALLALTSPDKGSDNAARLKGNNDQANKSAHRALQSFAKKNRKLLEELMPPLQPGSGKQLLAQPPVPTRARAWSSTTMQGPDSVDNKDPSLRAATAPSTRSGSRRESMRRMNAGALPMTAAWSAHTRGSMLEPSAGPMADEYAHFKISIDSSMDFSKLSDATKGTADGAEKSSRAVSPSNRSSLSMGPSGSSTPALSSGSGTATPSRGLPSRSSLRATEPLSLTLKNGSTLSGFAQTSGGWFYARDAAGNECYYRSALQGGHAAMVMQRNLGLDAPAAPPLPRRGTIYKRNAAVMPLRQGAAAGVSASVPVSLAGSRAHSPVAARTLSVFTSGSSAAPASLSTQSAQVSPRTQRRQVLGSKRTSYAGGALLRHTNLDAFRKSHQPLPDSTREESASELLSPRAGVATPRGRRASTNKRGSIVGDGDASARAQRRGSRNSSVIASTAIPTGAAAPTLSSAHRASLVNVVGSQPERVSRRSSITMKASSRASSPMKRSALSARGSIISASGGHSRMGSTSSNSALGSVPIAAQLDLSSLRGHAHTSSSSALGAIPFSRGSISVSGSSASRTSRRGSTLAPAPAKHRGSVSHRASLSSTSAAHSRHGSVSSNAASRRGSTIGVNSTAAAPDGVVSARIVRQLSFLRASSAAPAASAANGLSKSASAPSSPRNSAQTVDVAPKGLAAKRGLGGVIRRRVSMPQLSRPATAALTTSSPAVNAAKSCAHAPASTSSSTASTPDSVSAPQFHFDAAAVDAAEPSHAQPSPIAEGDE